MKSLVGAEMDQKKFVYGIVMYFARKWQLIFKLSQVLVYSLATVYSINNQKRPDRGNLTPLQLLKLNGTAPDQ